MSNHELRGGSMFEAGALNYIDDTVEYILFFLCIYIYMCVLKKFETIKFYQTTRI